ncbi:MAG: flagellar export chaperone FlgN, partial [Pseudomonadota bacterium]|nr:flagellar export chaperone FlgN [Pseudomonadota bacterium]
TENRTDDLAVLADRKLACAQRLEQSASPAFAALLRDAQQRSRMGLAPAGADQGQLWLLLREAAELNRTNGVLIDQHLKQVRLSLARIEPVSPTRQLYGRDGQGNAGTRGRSFGSA